MPMSIPMTVRREPYGRFRFAKSQLGTDPIAELRRPEARITAFVYRGFGNTLHASVRTPDAKACFKILPQHVTEETDEVSADPVCLVGDELLTWLIAHTNTPFKTVRGHRETVTVKLP